jgi:hypothetical protein
MEKKLRVV